VNQFFTRISEVELERLRNGKLYQEFLRVPTMSAGLYVLAAGATDTQTPHHEDEIYYVIRGKGRFRAGVRNQGRGQEEDHEVSAGSVLFVPAGVEHRFHDIVEELAALVFFAPAET
jgi:mannose-6-phosphate isomerase-like protein (cupin superfamily)